MKSHPFDDAHPRKRNISNFSTSSNESPTRPDLNSDSGVSASKPKKIKLSENLLPNLLEKMNVECQDDGDQFASGPILTGYSPNGRRSPDGILTKSEFKSAFQCKSLQKIQEDENEYKNDIDDINDAILTSSDESDDCIFAEQPKRVFPESVKQDFLKFNIDLPTIIPFKVPSSMNSLFHTPKNQKLQDSESRDSEFRFRDPDLNKNLQVMTYQPQKLTSPKERRVDREKIDSPGEQGRRRITAITDLDFEASLDMDL